MTREDATRLAMLEVDLAAFKVLVDARRAADALALVLQADEYARRLEVLNHQREDERHLTGTYLPITTYDAKHTELEKSIEVLRERMVTVEAVAKGASEVGSRLGESQTWLTRAVIGSVLTIVLAGLIALGTFLLNSR